MQVPNYNLDYPSQGNLNNNFANNSCWNNYSLNSLLKSVPNCGMNNVAISRVQQINLCQQKIEVFADSSIPPTQKSIFHRSSNSLSPNANGVISPLEYSGHNPSTLSKKVKKTNSQPEKKRSDNKRPKLQEQPGQGDDTIADKALIYQRLITEKDSQATKSEYLKLIRQMGQCTGKFLILFPSASLPSPDNRIFSDKVSNQDKVLLCRQYMLKLFECITEHAVMLQKANEEAAKREEDLEQQVEQLKTATDSEAIRIQFLQDRVQQLEAKLNFQQTQYSNVPMW